MVIEKQVAYINLLRVVLHVEESVRNDKFAFLI